MSALASRVHSLGNIHCVDSGGEEETGLIISLQGPWFEKWVAAVRQTAFQWDISNTESITRWERHVNWSFYHCVSVLKGNCLTEVLNAMGGFKRAEENWKDLPAVRISRQFVSDWMGVWPHLLGSGDEMEKLVRYSVADSPLRFIDFPWAASKDPNSTCTEQMGPLSFLGPQRIALKKGFDSKTLVLNKAKLNREARKIGCLEAMAWLITAITVFLVSVVYAAIWWIKVLAIPPLMAHINASLFIVVYPGVCRMITARNNVRGVRCWFFVSSARKPCRIQIHFRMNPTKHQHASFKTVQNDLVQRMHIPAGPRLAAHPPRAIKDRERGYC